MQAGRVLWSRTILPPIKKKDGNKRLQPLEEKPPLSEKFAGAEKQEKKKS